MQYDLVIIGAGPAGMAAAIEAASQELSVVLLDEQAESGGQVYRSVASVAANRSDDLKLLGADYAKGLGLSESFTLANIDYRANATVWNIDSANGSVFYSSAGLSYSIASKKILIATGAIERPCLIPGWTLAGVMTAGSAQNLLKSSGIIPDVPTVLAGCGPLLLLIAAQLQRAGVEISAVIETTSWRNYLFSATGLLQALLAPEYLLKGIRMRAELKRAHIPMYSSATELKAIGKDKLQAVRFKIGSNSHTIYAPSLFLHEGIIPNTALSRQLGLKHEWCSLQQHWQPYVTAVGGTSDPNIYLAGDGASIYGANAAEHSGHIAALHIAQELKVMSRTDYKRQVRKHQIRRWRHRAIRPLLNKLFVPNLSNSIAPKEDMIVCRCYEVNQKLIEGAVVAGCDTPDQVKSLLRCGMGPCQGRMCALSIAKIIADVRKVPIENIGVFGSRPPIKPITLRELASLKQT